MKSIRFTASHNADYLHAQLVELREAINQEPGVIFLDIAGSVSSPPGFTLCTYGILQQRQSTTKLVTSANSPLLGCDTLLWLAGDARIIAPNAYIHIPSFDNQKTEEGWVGETIPVGSDAVEVLTSENRRLQAASAELFLRDLDRVLRTMNEYLPVSEYQGRALEMSDLRELHLVGGEVDRLLDKIGAGSLVKQNINKIR